jgi:peptide/nickel transport system substrate-binding protein
MRVRLLGLLAALLVVLLPTTANAASTPTPSASSTSSSTQKKTLTVGIINDIDSLNPFVGFVVESYEVWGLMYDTLTGYSAKDFSAVPGLAKSWTTSADGKTWTYTLQSGVKWSDGTPLSAHDAAYTFNRIIDGTAEQTNYGNYVANIVKAEAPDDTTLILTTKTPSPTMLHLAVPILPEHIWKQVGEKQVSTFKNDPSGTPAPVGSGPYVLAERKVGQYVRLTANKDYWGGAPHMDEVVFRVYSSAEALAQALRKGEIDIADSLEANVFNSLKGVDGITTVAAKYSGFNEIAFNYGAALTNGTPIGDGHPALKDKRVRVALAHAVDLNTILQRAAGGYGSVATGVIPSMYSSLHYEAPQPYDFNIAEANKLLDEAGYKRGADGIRRMPDGTHPLKFRFFARSESKPSQTTMQFVKEWFAQVGVQIIPKTISEDQLTEAVTTGNFDMFEWGWVVEPDPDFQLSVFTCDQRSYKEGGQIQAGLSDGFYCNPAYDALYAKQKTQIDPAQRADTVKAAQKMLYDDAPYLVEYYYDDLQAYRSDKIAGVVNQPEPDGVIIFQYGTYTYRNVMTKADYDAANAKATGTTDAAATTSGGSSTGLFVGGAVALVVLLGGGFLLMRRNRQTAADRE